MTCSATYALALRMTERWADKTLKPFLVSSSAVQLAWTQKGAHGSDRAVSGRFSGTARPPPHGFACRCAAKSSVWHISTNFGLVSRRRLKRNPRSCSAASWEYGIRAGLACQTGDFAARRHSEIVRRPGSTANPLIGPVALPCARASLPSLVGGRPSNQPSNSTACGNYLHVSLFFGNFAIMTDRVHVLRVFHTCAPVAEYTRKRG